MDEQTVKLPLAVMDDAYLTQVRYAMSFASEGVHAYEVENNELVLKLRPGADAGAVRTKATKLLERFADRRFAMRSRVHFRQERPTRKFDAWGEMVERRWVRPVGHGLVALRALPARLFRAVDAKVSAEIAARFGAEHEVYPAAIECRTLDRVKHFTSFPEHVDFVSHLREDVDVLQQFSDLCRQDGWSSEHHDGAMAPSDIALSPSCCYHCYEAMERWKLERPGRCITAVVNCHRYEGGNLTTLSRLRSFHMREVVWVGHPDFVNDSREQGEKLLLQWARDWDLDCLMENANDVFFTEDYAVKATFQRQNEGKRELRMTIPWEERSIAVSSSNFHGSTFGRAFGIEVEGRPAVSACMGWGLERWVYAVLAQFGLETEKWPARVRSDLEKYAPDAPAH